MFWVEGDIGSTHIGVARHLVFLVVVGEFKLCLCAQGSVYDTSHLTTPDDDIHIGIHGTLVVSGKDDTGIIVVGSGLFGLIRHEDLSRRIILVVPCSVDIHRNGTFDRQIWRSHHAIEFRLCRLATTCTDSRIEARLDGDAEPLLAMRHGCFEGINVFLGIQRIETAIVIETSEYLHRGGDGTIDGTIIDSIIIETFHLDTFTHLQVMVLAEDVLIGSTARTGIFEGDMLEAGISPKWQARVEVSYLDGTTIIYLVIFTRDGCVAEEWRALCCLPLILCQNSASVILGNIETCSLVIGNIPVTFTHQYDDVLIP